MTQEIHVNKHVLHLYVVVTVVTCATNHNKHKKFALRVNSNCKVRLIKVEVIYYK